MPSRPVPKPCWNTSVAKPNAAPTVSRFIRIDVIATTRLRNTMSSSRNATIRMRPIAYGARPVSTAVRSRFCAAGPPTLARGRRDREAGAQRVDERRGAGVVDGSGAGDAHDDSAGRRGRCDDLARRPRRALLVATATTVGPRCGRRGDERGRGRARSECAGEHVVAVAARVALVDDLGARACRDAYRKQGR